MLTSPNTIQMTPQMLERWFQVNAQTHFFNVYIFPGMKGY